MSARQLKRIIGVDFGTSTSVVCYKDYPVEGPADPGQPKYVQFELRLSSTPTLVYIDEQGHKCFGHEAERGARQLLRVPVEG